MDEFDEAVNQLLDAIEKDDPNVGFPAILKLAVSIVGDVRRIADALDAIDTRAARGGSNGLG